MNSRIRKGLGLLVLGIAAYLVAVMFFAVEPTTVTDSAAVLFAATGVGLFLTGLVFLGIGLVAGERKAKGPAA